MGGSTLKSALLFKLRCSAKAGAREADVSFDIFQCDSKLKGRIGWDGSLDASAPICHLGRNSQLALVTHTHALHPTVPACTQGGRSRLSKSARSNASLQLQHDSCGGRSTSCHGPVGLAS